MNVDADSFLGSGCGSSSSVQSESKLGFIALSVSLIILLKKEQRNPLMLFSLHCFTSSSPSFNIPFVGGSGPPRSQIPSSQSITNKGQLQRTAETKDSGSKGIRKWTDSCGGALHVRVCDFDFKMGKCVLSNRRPTQQTLGWRPGRCRKARRGEGRRRPLRSPEQKIIDMDFSANQQVCADCLNVKMGTKCSSEWIIAIGVSCERAGLLCGGPSGAGQTLMGC